MPRSIDNLSINPLFLDALSGEFRPNPDPEQIQSLGMLAVETFQKGELIIPRIVSPKGPVIYSLGYQPAWSLDAKVSILLYEQGDFTHMSSVGIYRDMPGLDGASFIKSPFNEPPLYLRLDQHDHEQSSTIWPLELGAPLDEARSAATGVVQEFFC